MRWFETNLANFGRFLDEMIEHGQDWLRRSGRGPTLSTRIRDAGERARNSVRGASERASEGVEQIVRSMRSEERPVPLYIWPMIVMTVVATAGFTYVMTNSFSVPPPTAEELEMQRNMRKEAIRTRSAFEAFASQPERVVSPSKKAGGTGGK